MSLFKDLVYREDFQSALEYLQYNEVKHAPKFDMVGAPEELQELMQMAYMPRSKERSKWLNDYVEHCWSAPDGQAEVLLAEDHLNVIRYVNRYLRKANAKLKQDGYLVVAFDTAAKRRLQFYSKYSKIVANFLYFNDFIWHRVFPKLWLTRGFYYLVNKKARKVFPRSEVLGRLYYCGFDVVAEQYIHDRYCVIAQKRREPSIEHHSYGPIVKLRRVGKDGKLFNVYKFRTMYAYAEYLQTYVYQNNSLQKGGKFNDDYRITTWGRVFRKYWIDELPMIFNILKGQMKLVGVRPLSEQYFSLYTKEMQELRVKNKPGMLPPFYVDMPETIEEIQENERKYCLAYEKHPLRTDWVYFWRIMANIVLRKKRSK